MRYVPPFALAFGLLAVGGCRAAEETTVAEPAVRSSRLSTAVLSVPGMT